jgi:radical SAM-linked protein
MPKLFLLFEKGESVRWLGHLDILRTFERAIRRAQLPIAFTAGFNPRERLTFISALSTGITGDNEPLIIELNEDLPCIDSANRLNATLPPGFRIKQCGIITDEESKTLLKSITQALYATICSCPVGTDSVMIENAIENLLALPSLPLERQREGRSRQLDARPFLYSLSLEEFAADTNRAVITMTVGQGESGNLKSVEVITLLSQFLPGIKPRKTVRRMMLDGSGQPISLSLELVN